MKILSAIAVMLFASASWAADPAKSAAPAPLAGEVLEVQDVDSYTYLRLKTKDGETWAATYADRSGAHEIPHACDSDRPYLGRDQRAFRR